MTGIICFDKPEGITSFLAVKKARWLFGEKKAGHCGTLDPLATGVLPIMLGGATRFLDFLPVSSKAYVATMRLGVTTDTLDITGTVLSENDVDVSLEDIEKVLPKFRGDIMQVPPMYSAIKKDGVRMYDLARQGVEVEREPRPVTIYSLEVSHISENDYSLSVSCSSGTYVRTLIDDIGRELGCGATMVALRRTEACGFPIEKTYTLEELEKAKEEGTIDSLVISVDEALGCYDEIRVSEAQGKRFRNGGELDLLRIKSTFKKVPGLYRVYCNEEFLGLGEIAENSDVLAVKRVYVSR